MATVAFDAVGPGASGFTATTTSPATWTHVNGGNGIIVALVNAVGGTNDYTTVTYGGVTLALLGYQASNGNTLGGVALYGLVGATCPTGSNTVSAAFTGGGQATGGSISVTNAASLRTAQAASGAATPLTLGVTGTTAGSMVVSAYCSGTLGTNTATGGGTLRWDNPHDSNSGSGNASGATIPSAAGTTTVSYGITSDWWGLVAVEVLPLGGGQFEIMPQQMSRLALRRRKSAQWPISNIQSPDASIFPGVVAAQATLPLPGLPPTHLYITGLSGSTSADYFVDQSANPRWMWCDAAWTIVYSAGRAGGANTYQTDIDFYTSTRGGQGYTALECNLLPNNEYVASGLVNTGGFHPFNTGVDPGSGLNNSYWTVLDYLLNSAANQGITMFLNLCMGEDLASGVAGAWTSTQKTQYGNAVATRYLSTPNIIWMMGDDGGTDATTATNIMTGVRAAGDTRPVAFENGQETTSRFGLKLNDAQPWNSSGFIAYQWVYNYAPSYQGVEYAYAESSPIPVLRGDGYYFGTIGGPDDKVSREQFWWSVSSGSRGYSWGVSDGGTNGGFAAGWKTGLTLAAEEAGTAGDFQNNVFPAVTTYLATLPNWQKLQGDVANAFMTSGRGTRAPYQTEGIQNQYTGTPNDTYVSGSYAPDGSIAMIYFSRGVTTTVTIDQTKLASGYTATWVDPANAATSAGTPGSTFTKPAGANSAGDHDWLLLLQGPAAALGPGQQRPRILQAAAGQAAYGATFT